MYATRHDLSARLEKLLNACRADALDLESASKQAHGNVKGPNFIALHELFDQLHETLEQQVDTLAERITALGGTAMGTVRAVAVDSSLKPYPVELIQGIEHLEALADRLAQFGKKVRSAIDSSARLGDAGISREVDKSLCLLEAHLQARR